MNPDPNKALPTASRTSLYGEQLLSIPEVPEFLPSRRGKRLHISTVYRWALKGVRGKVLESTMLGGVRYTSLEAIQRFMGNGPELLLEQRRKAEIERQLAQRGIGAPGAHRRRN